MFSVGIRVTAAAITSCFTYAALICSPHCCVITHKHKQGLPLCDSFCMTSMTMNYSRKAGQAAVYGLYHDVWAEIMMCGLKLWCVVWKAALNMGPCLWQFARESYFTLCTHIHPINLTKSWIVKLWQEEGWREKVFDGAQLKQIGSNGELLKRKRNWSNYWKYWSCFQPWLVYKVYGLRRQMISGELQALVLFCHLYDRIVFTYTRL